MYTYTADVSNRVPFFYNVTEHLATLLRSANKSLETLHKFLWPVAQNDARVGNVTLYESIKCHSEGISVSSSNRYSPLRV